MDEDDILPREESLLDLIRVACYIKDVDKALALVQTFHDRGYETTLNIMALSNVMENESLEAFELIRGASWMWCISSILTEALIIRIWNTL